jgi:hypothetical protein
MSYVLLHADLTGLDDAAAEAFVDAAADLDLDVIDLAPDLADAEVIILISTSLAALVSKLAERTGAGAGEKLWDLIQRLCGRGRGGRAIEDRESRVTFVFDEQARRAGPAAAAAMISIGEAIDAIADGTTLGWDGDTGQWSARQVPAPAAPERPR